MCEEHSIMHSLWVGNYGNPTAALLGLLSFFSVCCKRMQLCSTM